MPEKFLRILPIDIVVRYIHKRYRMPIPSDESSGPLSPAVLHILLALAEGELHGYAIMQEVERTTEGSVRMGPGTLYGALKKCCRMAALLIAGS